MGKGDQGTFDGYASGDGGIIFDIKQQFVPFRL